MACSGPSTLRCWLLVQNLALFTGALALLALSVDALAEDEPRVAVLLGVTPSRGAALLLSCVGGLGLLLSLLGCCGAATSSRCLLGVFGCLSALLVFVTLAGFAAALVLTGPGAAEAERSMNASMARYGDDTEDTAVWDFLQRDFHCCGVRNGTDWARSVTLDTAVPSSCCRPAGNGTYLHCEDAPTADNSYTDAGCFASAQRLVGDHTAAFAGATAAVALFLVFSVALACVTVKRLRQASYERLTV